MKRLLILLLSVLLLAGCSKEVPEANNTLDVHKEIDLNNDKKDEPANSNEQALEEEQETEAEDKQTAVEPEKKQEPTPNEESPSTEEPAVTEPVEIVIEKPSQESAEAAEDEQNVLKIKGLLENELKLSLNDLKAMNDIIFEADFYSLNSYGTTGYTHFKGVKLWELLESKALINPAALKVTITAQDGYSIEFTIEQIKMEYMDETNPDNKYPIIIAWEENGEEYSADKGAPYKLVVGQKEPGDVNKPQWVSNIDIIIIE